MAYTEQDHIAKVNAFEDVTIDLRNIYEAKNRDYGDSFSESFQEWGLPVACIRLGDKLNRLKSFAKNQEMLVTDEKVEDTLRDLANYAIMTLMALEYSDKQKNREK